jgi:hypothetical protein
MKPLSISLLTVCGIEELPGHQARNVTHVLSLLDPDWPEIETFRAFGEHHRTTLKFHDGSRRRFAPPHHEVLVLQAAAQGGLGQGPVDDVALGVAAAEAADDRSRGEEELGGAGVVAAPEGGEAFDQRQAGGAGPAGGLRRVGVAGAVAGDQPVDVGLAAGAEPGHRGVPVVERVERAVGVGVPGGGELGPAVADVVPGEVERQSRAEASTRSRARGLLPPRIGPS